MKKSSLSRLSLLALGIIILGASCSVQESSEKNIQPIVLKFDMTDTLIDKDVKILNQSTIITDTLGDNKFSQVDSIIQYGSGLTYVLPDSVIGTDLQINIKANVLGTEAVDNGVLVISLCTSGDHKSMFYQDLKLDERISISRNQWITVQNNMEISGDINTMDKAELNVYLWKPRGKGLVKLDNLEISILPTPILD